MAIITHESISLRRSLGRRVTSNQSSNLVGSQLAVFLVALSIICGLVSFVLCLAGEPSRSEATWYLLSIRGDGSKVSECFYNGSGRNALACSICAFLLLAVAMFAEHAYMLVAVSSPSQTKFTPALPEDPRLASSARSLTGQACFLFLLTWICFAIAEVCLMVCIGVESGHLNDWTKPRPVCHTIRPGLFAAAGILGLIAVFLGFMVYLTALRMQRLHNVDGAIPHAHQMPYGPHNLTPTAPIQHPSNMPNQAPIHEAEKVATSV